MNNLKEDKELLLKDLCARLPYGVKMQKFNEQNVFVDLYAINLNNYTIDFYTYKGKSLTIANTSKLARYGILLYKPCLFPMSSMTEEQFLELTELCDMYDNYHDYNPYEYWGVQVCRKHIHGNKPCFSNNYKAIDWLNRNHFDYRGLISKGLAIDCTNLNIY